MRLRSTRLELTSPPDSDFSTDVPIADAVGEIGTGVEEVQGAYDEMRDGLGCEGEPAAS